MPALRRGDLLPRILVPPPGPRSRGLCAALAQHEAPGINTLGGGARPILWQEARGANVLDVDGNRYIDFTSGFGAAALGHRPSPVTAAVRRQSARLLHGLGDVHAHALRADLCAELARRAPFPEAQVYFAVSGSDAVEIAIETAALATGRPGVLVFEGAYHGLSQGVRALVGSAAFRTPLDNLLRPHVHRLPFGTPVARIASLLGKARPAIGAVLVEPIQGRGGIHLPPDGWLAALADACRRHGALLLADEILTGGYRTGSFFAVSADGVTPDLVCCGKALAGGLPFAAVLAPRRLFAAWPDHGEALHTATFVAHPLACAATLATLRALDLPVQQQARRRLSAALAEQLSAWPRQGPTDLSVRGRGLLWGLELPWDGAALQWSRAALQEGLLLLPAGAGSRVLEILPPYCTTPRQLAAALAILQATRPTGPE